MKKYKIFNLFIFIICIFFSISIKVNAASWTIISSKASVASGQSFTVRIHGNDVVGQFTISVNNGRSSESVVWKDENTDRSFTVTATGSGTVYVKVVATDCSDINGNPVGGSDNVSVNIINSNDDGSRSNSSSNKTYSNTANQELSNNNYLKSLTIDGYNLSPSFNKDVTSYNVEVDELSEKIKINAEAEDKTATIEGIGEKSLEKDNIFQIVVKAENGQVKTYTINVLFKDDNPIKVKKGNKTYTLVKRKSLIKEFDDYKSTTIKINNQEIPALYNKTTKLTLVGLRYKDKVYLYRYNKETNTYVRYIEYDFKNVKLVLFKLSDKMIPDGYKEYTIKINGYNTKVYKLRKSSKYSLIYGMNIKTGIKTLYLHDSKENTVQRYTTEAMTALKNQNSKYQKICIGLCGGVALLVIVLLIFISKSDKKRKIKNKVKRYENEK
ncbi:MAG: cadherin-like beta sandwich domain-containing protein [Bacilli bacterium]